MPSTQRAATSILSQVSAEAAGRASFAFHDRLRYRPRAVCNSLHAAIILIASTVAGCSGPEGPQRYEITGTVTLDGQPAPHGVITLVPQESTNGPTAGADIIEGKFFIPRSKGPVAGEYVFQFTGSTAIPSGETVAIKGGARYAIMLPVFPPKYGMSSTITRHIGLDQQHFDFELTSR